MLEYKILINGEDVTDYVPLPITEQISLDESLDMGVVRLCYTDKKEPYRPLTNVEVIISIPNQYVAPRHLYFFISSDEVTEVVQTGQYNHSLLLVEQTKWLERFIGRTKTVTNPLVKVIDPTEPQGKRIITTTQNKIEEVVSVEGYTTPIKQGKQQFRSVASVLNVDASYSGYLRISKNGITEYQLNDIFGVFDRTLVNGTYYIEYVAEKSAIDKKELYFYIDVVENTETVPNKTITDVVNILLATIETQRESETPRFTFDSEQAERYSTVDCPELTLTGTLWEQLKTIGNYIHSIPRLQNGVISFAELGSNKELKITADRYSGLTPFDITDYVSSTNKFDIEQFAYSVDSNVDNFVKETDLGDSGIVEPYTSGLKTVRNEVGKVKIEDTSVLIETKYPIEKILSVTCGFIDGQNEIVGDITPYVFENAEYMTLSSISDNYPLSKGYAIRYTTGKNNIDGLSFELPDAIDQANKDYAIINIIKKVVGRRIGRQEIQKLQFRVTYIPVISGRAKQVKSYLDGNAFMSTIAYNQSAQKVSSSEFGETIKGVVARLGNPEKSLVFIDNDIENIPAVGYLFDKDYYISVVRVEYYKDFFRCEIALSKNFNRLNEFVGVKNEVRFYEISERQAIDSQIIYEDYCVIGDAITSDNKAIVKGIQGFAQGLVGREAGANNVSIAEVTGYSNGIPQQSVVLPVISCPLGNSVLFNFRYDDNYSAGNIITESGSARLQYQLQYTDERGELDSLKIRLGNSSSSQNDFESAVKKGDLLPMQNAIDGNTNIWVFDTENDNIVIKKDNREIPTFNYQLHFVANRRDIVLGSLAKVNSFASYIQVGKQLHLLKQPLEKYQEIVPVSQTAVFRDIITPTINGNTIDLGSFVNDTQMGKWYGWAIIDELGRLVLGENIEINDNDTIELPKLTFTHKVL